MGSYMIDQNHVQDVGSRTILIRNNLTGKHEEIKLIQLDDINEFRDEGVDEDERWESSETDSPTSDSEIGFSNTKEKFLQDMKELSEVELQLKERHPESC